MSGLDADGGVGQIVASAQELSVVALCGASLLATAALYTDASRREIPHWLIVGLVLLWMLAVPTAPEALNSSAWAALLCGAGALVAGLVFHRLGWLGGGDGKLLGVMALWLGPWDLGLWLIGTAFLGLLMVLLALARPGGDFQVRGIPFAWAIVPPAVALLLARAASLAGP